jgi:hypothetical protein
MIDKRGKKAYPEGYEKICIVAHKNIPKNGFS